VGWAKAGRRKKYRELTTTEKPAKLVIKIEIKEASRAGDKKQEIRKERIRNK